VIENLQDTGLDNGRLLVVLDLTATAASGLKSLDDHQRLLISNLAEDDMLAIEPAGDNSGDEELGAVAVETSCQLCFEMGVSVCLRVRTGIGHGQKSWLGVLAGEVLVGELLTVDGLATSALCNDKLRPRYFWGYRGAYVATGEVTALKHELRDDTVEGRASISETLLAGAKSAEVLSSLWDYIIVEIEVDATLLLC
jgi:hypothetical protein